MRGGQPLVKQMLMGGGKTTVVGPMLALLLADGETLVVQTMPLALLEQSKATLRATFSSIMRKRVFTLQFDRSSEISWSVVEKLQAAAQHSGVVLCSTPTIKSLQLKLIKKMHVLSDVHGKHHPRMELDVVTLVQVMKLFKSGCYVMDEVDLLLHPLKSSSTSRWATRCRSTSTPSAGSARSTRSTRLGGQGHVGRLQGVGPRARDLDAARRRGAGARARGQGLPVAHLVLLNTEWYHALKPVPAKWMQLWLEAST